MTARKRMKPRGLLLHQARSAGLLVIGLTAGSMTMAVEEPKFEVTARDGSCEVRRYAPVIVAETYAEGDMDAASRMGFKLIADYIFGNNQLAGTAGEKASQKIAMTAPATVEPVAAADVSSMASATQWRIHFVMPGQYSMQTLPKPNNEAVKLRAMPARTFAVLSYSGFNTASRVQEKTDELALWMKSRNLETVGAPQLARYDPPWTLPMWRRNEIQMEIKTP